MQWLNEPVHWQRTADTITVSVDPGTDFWRETGYGYIRDSGHVYGEVLAGDFDVSVRVRGTFSAHYDQAGIMLRVDDRVWLKSGMEFFEGRARLSTVLTLGRSSWIVTDLPEGTDEITLRAARRGDAVEIRYLLPDGPAELAALVFLPPGREVLAGVMCAAPEGPGFAVTFSDLHVAAREWEPEAGQAPGAWAGQDTEDWIGETAGVGVTGWEPEDEAEAGGWDAETADTDPGTGLTVAAYPAASAGAEPSGGRPGQDPARSGEDAGSAWLGAPAAPPAAAPAAAAWEDGRRPPAGPAAAADPPVTDPAADWERLAADAAGTADPPAPGGEGPPDVPGPAPSRSGPFPVLGRLGRGKPPAAGDAAAPPDPADEWISLLTADPPED